jgi:hypothetical protein
LTVRLVESILSYLADYEKVMVPDDGNFYITVNNHLDMSKRDFDMLLDFIREYHKDTKGRKSEFFLDGLMMGLYLVGRAYDLDYTAYSKALIDEVKAEAKESAIARA